MHCDVALTSTTTKSMKFVFAWSIVQQISQHCQMKNAEIIWKIKAMQNNNLSLKSQTLMKDSARQINGQFSWSPATCIRRSAWRKTVLPCKQLSIRTIFSCALFSSIHNTYNNFHINNWRYPKFERASVSSVFSIEDLVEQRKQRMSFERTHRGNTKAVNYLVKATATQVASFTCFWNE